MKQWFLCVIWGTVFSEYCWQYSYSDFDWWACTSRDSGGESLSYHDLAASYSYSCVVLLWLAFWEVGPHPECWRLFGTKVSKSDWYVNCFRGKSSLSISFIIFFHKLHRFFQLLREVKLPIPPLLWVLSFLAELINNCWKCSCKSFPFSPSFISRCTVKWTRFLFLQNF